MKKVLSLALAAGPAPQRYQDKHYFRKHGPGAYYGQGRKQKAFRMIDM